PPGLQIKAGPLSGSRRLSMLGEEKITFPIAPSPDIRPFSSPPTAPSTGPATATAPQLSPFTTSSTSGVEDTSTDAGRYPQTLMIPRLDPLYPFILFVALGLGTIYTRLEATGRYTLLWTILLATGILLTYANGNNRAEKPSANSLLWGVGFGLVFSLPLLILVSSGLSSMVDILFPGALMSTRFQSLVIIAPAAETLFFRGAVQEHRGIVFGMLGAGITGLLIYWPVAAATPGYLAAMGLFTVVLAGIYSFVRMRNGLGAALASQITVNFMLLYLPSLFR
nr:hypothetical protein [Anaerolineae bacterium]